MTAAALTMIVPLAVAAGVAAGAVAACIPGLHVYNLMGFLALAGLRLEAAGRAIAPEIVAAVSVAMITAFAVLNAVPSVFLSAPDESALFTVMPGRRFLMEGRGREALMLTAAGALGAALTLAVFALWLLPRHVPRWHAIARPHFHWMLWCVIVFMLMSEWPRGGVTGQGGWRKFADAWKSTGAGLLTFLLAGIFGFVIMYRSPVPAERAFQNLMPAFVGLFGIPGLLMNIMGSERPPPQKTSDHLDVPARLLVNGVMSGALGGGFAALVPGVTGGVGGFLAGHAAAVRDDRMFLISQGAAKMTYYTGALMLFFAPGLHLTRGSGWLIRGLVNPWERRGLMTPALAAMILSAALAYLLADRLSPLLADRIARIPCRRLALGALALAAFLVAAMTGVAGLGIAFTGAAIGMVPLLYGSRRMNCLAVLLLPLACNMSGYGPRIAALLALV